MDIRSVLKSQYHAALKTLRLAIKRCPDVLWNDPADGPSPFWRVACHTLFFAHFYSHQDRKDLKPWPQHRRGSEDFDHPDPTPYTRDELLAYCDFCLAQVDANVDKLDLEAGQCGFPWYKMGTLEHQLVNIRHIQHHAAILSARLRKAGIEVEWVGKG